jgi:hypothetical protein
MAQLWYRFESNFYLQAVENRAFVYLHRIYLKKRNKEIITQ